MSLRCLETNGERYKENKLFVEDMLKYFPDYNFDIMKATISGWQSSQLKDDEDRLPTIEELIDYLLNNAKKERNNRLALIANKANDILANDFNKEYLEILAKAPRNSEGRLLAPNGKPSNLTERQYALVRSKAFKKWFGDWEKVAPQREFKHSLFRGQAEKPKIDKNGNLVLSPSYDLLSNNTGISFANNETAAYQYGNRYSKNPYIIELDAEYIDKTYPLKEGVSENARFIGDEYEDNVWEERLSTKKTILIPKEYYKIKRNVPDFSIYSDTELRRMIDEAEELFNNQDEMPFSAFSNQVSASDIRDLKDEWERRGKDEERKYKKVNYVIELNKNNTKVDSNSYTSNDDGEPLYQAIYDDKESYMITEKQYNDFIAGKNIKINTVKYEERNDYIELKDNKENSISKVIDENGEPLVVYHYTDNENLTKFSTEFDNYFARTGGTKNAIFFTTDNVVPGTEDNFLTSRKTKLSLFLNIKNLEIFHGTKDDLHKQGTSYREVVNKSSEREGSENGVVFTGFDDNRKENQTIYIVHNSNQIKSAESNIGTFSTTNDNIYLEHEYNLENPKKDTRLEELSRKNEVTINDLVLLISLSEYNDIINVLKELSTGKEKLLKDIKVSVINPLDYYSKANEIRSKFNGRRAYYDADTNTIVIDASANFSNGDASSVILHEIMHHITVDRILSNPSLREEFITLIKEYRKHYPNEYIGAIDNHYIEEFIADIWSNRTTIENLKKVEYKGKKHTTSLWDKILLFFKNKLFKGAVKDSMFELASNLLIDTINTNIKEYSKSTFYDSLQQETPITTQQLNNTQELDVEKAKATRDFLSPVTRRLTVLKLGRMFSNIVSREYDNMKLALDNRIANETDNKAKQELIFQRRKLSRYEVIKTLSPTTIFNRLKDTFQQYVNLTEELGTALEKQLLNKNSVFQKMPDAAKTNIAKGRFEHKKKLYQIILDNFKVLAIEASKGFALTEGVSLIFSDDSVILTLEQDTFNEEGLSDISENKEEKTKEGWIIDVRTVSSFSSLTNKIRQAINNIARVNKNGILEIDEMGDTIYLSGSYVHSELIKALAPIITEPKDMIPILLKLAVRKPWVNLIINKLQADPILFTEMYRAYNKSTLNYWILKPRVQKDGSVNTLTISINKMEGMDELFDSWRDNYEYGNKLDSDSVYNSNGEINKENVKKGFDLINEVRLAIYYVRQDTRETRISTVLNKDNVRKISKAFKMIGLGLEETPIADAIQYNIEDTRYEPDFNANTLVNALFTMYDDLMKNKDIKDGELADLANLYGRALENIAKIISFVTENTMESQVRHNKKSLYSHVNSGYMINLIKKLKNPDKFKEFIEKEYMPVDWFYDKNKGEWRNQLIKNLYNNQEDRDKLSHIVMLDYNGKEYADWDTLDSTLVLLNQFRSLPTKDDHGWAYYNIPVLSDTESAEFLRMRRYIKDFRSVINSRLVNLVLQEIDRIDLVRRRSQDPSVEKITNFDMVKTVDKNGVEHIKKGGAEFKFFPELNFLKIDGKSFLDAYYDRATMSDRQLNAWIAQLIDNILEDRFNRALTKWKQVGLLDRVDDNPNGKFKYFETSSRTTAEDLLKEWYWNSTFAQSQIIELLTTDLAYYKTKGNDFLTDFIKRAKEFHAPIERLNTEAEWIVNGERKKICYDDSGNLMKNRVLYLKDCEVPSLTLDDLLKALDKNPKLTQAEKNIIIGAYKSINMADALAYRTLDSFRRTLIMAGMWSDDEETSYNNIKNGNFRLEDITTLWNTRKPYLYTQTNQSNLVDGGMIRVSTQHKNSEMVMLTQAVLGTIMSTGKLAALERFMTNNNIDAVMFESAVKTGGLDIINLNNINVSEIEEYLSDYINTNSLAIHEFDYEDYGIQTATPEHGIDAMQLVGTQIRRIIASNQDMTDPNFRFKYGNKEWTVLEWQDLYNMVNTANIKESFMRLDKKFSDIKEIEKLLLSEVRSNPRYDSDIELALTLNNKEVFNIPLLDPSITYKILSLLTSIVKSRVTKLKIAGGAFIQASAWGFKLEPKVIYNDDGSVKHIECYLPCTSEELYNMLIDENTGEVDINKKYKDANGKWQYIVPEKYREFIGYRVPTESFYSCAPFKIIGFLPRQVGTIIVVPRDIVSMAGSDYDVDKVYAMLHTLNFKRQYNIKQAWSDFYNSHPKITLEIDENYNKLFLDFLTTWNEDGETLDLEDLKDAQNDFKEWLKSNNVKKSLFSETALEEFSKWFKLNKLDYLLNIIPLTVKYRDINKENIQGNKPTRKELLDNMLNNNNKEQRDSLLIDLMWAVLTNKETTPKLMKPGGFDGPKKAARIATILNNNTIQSLKDKGYNIETLIKDLNSKSVGELTDIVDEMSEVLNPLTPDTWVTMHDRNMAGAALIPIAATNNAGHALMQHTLLLFKKPIQINGKLYLSLHDIKNADGKYITENIAEFLAAVVDNAKDPVAGDMNLNTITAGIAFTLLRLGVNATTTALFLSLPIVRQAVAKVSKEKISLLEAFKDITDKIIFDLKSQGKNVPEILNISKFNFSDSWLALSILGYNNMSFGSSNQFERDALLNQVRVGQLMQVLSKMALDLTDFTLATRADTQNGGAGPTIADTLNNIERYTTIEDSKTSLENWRILISNAFKEDDYFNTDDIINSPTPILLAFFTYGLESVLKLFKKILPYYNDLYKTIVEVFTDNTRSGKLSVNTRNKIYTLYINYLLSKVVDKRFANADEQRDYFINKFPLEFEKIIAENPDLKKYDFISRIVKLNPTKYNPAPALKFNNVGRISDILRNLYQLDWESLLYINDKTKQLAYDLLTYNMYRGLEFSPSGFGHLVPSIVKMTHPYYVRVLNDTLVDNPADYNDVHRFFDLFIRNNLNVRELVPDCSEAKFDENEDFEGNKIYFISLDERSPSNDRKTAKPYGEKAAMEGDITFLPYVMRKINGVEHYYKLTSSLNGSAEYKEILPLGKKNRYYEYNGLESDIESVIKPSEPSPILDNNNVDGEQSNPLDNQAIQGYGTNMVNLIKQGLLNIAGNPTLKDNSLNVLNSIDNQATDPQSGKPLCGGSALLTL